MKRILFSLVFVPILVMVACSHAPAIPQTSQPINGVEVQLAMILDASVSINSTEWDIMVTGLAAAVNSSDCVPQDGSVELTVIQFGGYSSPGAQIEIDPVVITSTNAATVANQIRAITQMGGYTPLSCGIRLAADTLAASSNFDPDIKQAINIVTDGVPNRCCPGPWNCGGCAVSGCAEANASAVAARDYLITTLNMTDDQDEIDAEGIGITEANRNWLRDYIVWPQPGYIAPPFDEGPGWVRVFATFEEFVPSLCEKFEFIVYGSITVHKFNDLNGDGDQDSGEANLEGWTMTLYSGPDCSDSPLASNETNADGNVVFTGLEAGTYSVRETLQGGWTNSTALCQQVTIALGESVILNFGNLCISPTAAFNATPTSGCAPLTVNFTDQSTENPTSWNWSFPGGTPSSHTGQMPLSITYNSTGSYNITLTVSNACGSDDETKTNYVTVYAQPTATASSNSPVCEGATIELYGGPDGMASYNWSGPGGWTSILQNPTRSSATTAMAGTYTLTVTNSNGCTDDESTSVTVDTKPTATASSNSPVCEGATIELYGGPDGMTSYNWSDPGGWTSILQNPTRSSATTAMAGTYTLTVTNSNGCTDDESTSVTVDTKPTASTSSNSPVSEGTTIALTGGPNGMTSYNWTGPGGWTSNAQNATRSSATLAMAGTYTLTVTNSNGCTDDESTSVTVNAKPTASAPSNPPACCVCRSLMISSTEGGSVTTPGEGELSYGFDTVVSLVASPDPGYKFVNWSGDVATIADVHDASTTITMVGYYSITANFEAEEDPPGEPLVQYELTVSSTMGGSVTTPGEGTLSYAEGTVVSLTANPAYGYEFVNWTGDGIADPDSATTTVTVNGNCSIKANFAFEQTSTTGSAEGSSDDPLACFIATAAYGTPTAEQIDVLREFRDIVLLESTAGSQFVALYYQLSPPVADFIAGNEFLRTLVRELLVDPVVWAVEATGNIWQN